MLQQLHDVVEVGNNVYANGTSMPFYMFTSLDVMKKQTEVQLEGYLQTTMLYLS